MPKHSRIVAVMIDMQHTKMAAETTRRYTVAKAFERLASMIVCGPTQFAGSIAVLGVGHGHQRAPEEDRADDERADDRGEDGLGRLSPGVLRLLGEGRGGVEPVDHEQAHEHRRPGTCCRSAGVPPRVEDHPDTLVVVEQREDEREHHHAQDLEDDAGVVHDRHEPHADRCSGP